MAEQFGHQSRHGLVKDDALEGSIGVLAGPVGSKSVRAPFEEASPAVVVVVASRWCMYLESSAPIQPTIMSTRTSIDVIGLVVWAVAVIVPRPDYFPVGQGRKSTECDHQECEASWACGEGCRQYNLVPRFVTDPAPLRLTDGIHSDRNWFSSLTVYL